MTVVELVISLNRFWFGITIKVSEREADVKRIREQGELTGGVHV